MVRQSPAVLHVAQPTEAGVPTCVLQFARDQVDRGWRIAVACPPSGDLPAWLGRDEIAHEPWPASRDPGASVPGEARALGRIVKGFAPDVVHLHSSKAGLAGRLIVRGRLPTVFQPHSWSFHAASGSTRRAALAWERFAARWTRVVVCVSEGERHEGESVGIRAESRVVPNGVDLTRWRPHDERERAAAKRELGVDARLLVVCVGRLSRQKGQDVLLRAWTGVEAAAPEARLVLVGDGPDRAALEAAVPSGVLFAGERRDVDRWLAAADLVVLPSRWEGLSLGLLEAMASGRSVVATDVAGVREALGEDAGAIVPVEEARPLAAAIRARLGDPALRRAEERRARARAEDGFDYRSTNDAIARLCVEIHNGG